MSGKPTYDELEAAYRDGKAVMAVNHINQREIVKDGIRYYCGWNSPCARTGEKGRWIVYKQTTEPQTIETLTAERDRLREQNKTFKAVLRQVVKDVDAFYKAESDELTYHERMTANATDARAALKGAE